MKGEVSFIAQQAQLVAEQAAEIARLREFVGRIATQRPEKPDYWCSCGQCEHNIEDAKELLEPRT